MQRTLARRRRGSRRWKKARHTLKRHARHVACQRQDFLHKLSTALVRRHTHIAVEDLHVRALGRGFLAKDVLDAGWGNFLAMLRYKAENAGSVVEAVDPAGTSQACSACGSLVPKDLSVRRHECPRCGYLADRDVNAVQNILARATFFMGPGSGLRAQSGGSSPKLAREAVSFR